MKAPASRRGTGLPEDYGAVFRLLRHFYGSMTPAELAEMDEYQAEAYLIGIPDVIKMHAAYSLK